MFAKAVAALALTCGTFTADLAAQNREPLVLCMGISNMAGPNSALYLLSSPVTLRPQTRCWNPTNQTLEPFLGYNAQGWQNSVLGRFGPDVGIAAALEIKYQAFTIVKLATPASPLSNNSPNPAPAWERSANELWPSVAAEVAAVERAVRAEGKEPYWAELVWIGWETDSNAPLGYGALFQQFVADMRLLTNSPGLSVTVERPMRHPMSGWSQFGMEIMQEDLDAVAHFDPLLRIVDLEPAGLTYKTDLVHRDPASSVLEGCLLGLAMVGTPLFAEIR